MTKEPFQDATRYKQEATNAGIRTILHEDERRLTVQFLGKDTCKTGVPSRQKWTEAALKMEYRGHRLRHFLVRSLTL